MKTKFRAWDKDLKQMFRNVNPIFDADPFMGSGTTAIACMNTNRNYIGFELDKEYYDKSIERINKKEKQIELLDV